MPRPASRRGRGRSAPSPNAEGAWRPDCRRQGRTVTLDHPAQRRSRLRGKGAVTEMLKKDCWSCGQMGHRYSRCPRPRSLFCYGCGVEGLTLRECPRCSSSWRDLGPSREEPGTEGIPLSAATEKAKGRKSQRAFPKFCFFSCLFIIIIFLFILLSCFFIHLPR